MELVYFLAYSLGTVLDPIAAIGLFVAGAVSACWRRALLWGFFWASALRLISFGFFRDGEIATYPLTIELLAVSIGAVAGASLSFHLTRLVRKRQVPMWDGSYTDGQDTSTNR